MSCLFCSIVAGEIPTDKVYEDENLLAFRDVTPQAPTHILIIPKEHMGSLDDITPENSGLVEKIFLAIPQIAKKEKLSQGYRVVTNIGTHGGQSVGHLHFHILGGRSLQWPPG